MPIRLSGLSSGLDTEAIVGALVSAYSFKKEKYTKAQTKLSWKQDAWKTLNSKVYSMYTSVGNMRYDSNYTTRKTSVSDSNKAKATASSTAIIGTQTLEISQLAKTAYITGAKLSDDITGKSKLSELGIKNEGTGDDVTMASIQVRANGKTTEIELDASMTMNDFTNKLSEAGVQANYDEKNHRLFVSARDSGKAGDFSITANNELGLNALINVGLMTSAEVSSITSNTTGADLVARKFTYTVKDENNNDVAKTLYGSKASFESKINNIVKAKSAMASDESSSSDISRAREILEENEDFTSYVETLFTPEEGEIVWSDITSDQIKEKANDIYAAADTTYDSAAQEATKAEITASINNVRDAYLNIATIKSNTYDSEAARAADLAEAEAKLTSVLNDPANAKWAEYIEENFGTVNSGTEDDYSDFWVQSDNQELANSVYYRVDLAAQISINGKEFSVTEDKQANKINGEDAVITLNGVKYTSNTNNITVNGLTIEALATTSDPLTITVSNDTDAIYDKVKDFLTDYNNLMNEMQKLYNADSAKDYEPLTDDEKGEMSESEIEKWEQKIKDSLLRRDSTLSGIISSMTMSMMKTYEINGETVSWSTFGIHTLGTLNAEKNEGYAYHIDGDSEDSYTSGNREKLKAALAEDPDKVIDFLKEMTKGLYDELDKKMKSTAVKSVYTVYNDKEMASEYSDYSTLIKTWTERVTDMEDAYYKKFTAMEKALATLQSNSSSISSLLGG